MIEIKAVSKAYIDMEAVKDIALSVNKGSIYGLVGSNGAGKTTLMKLLAGIYKPDKGEIFIDSEPVFENTAIKSKIIFIPDQLFHFTNYTIDDMALFYRQIYPTWNQERYLKLRDVFKIDITRRIKTLSKGMERQVGFWLALSIMPEVLILDEPLDGLDPVMRQKVKNLIIQDVAEREMTVFISSHNLRELEDLCDSIAIMHQGTILIQKDLDELKANVHKIQLAFADDTDFNLESIDLEVMHHEQRGSVHILIIRGDDQKAQKSLQRFNPAILDVLPLTLEEIFIYEMGGNGYEIENILY